MTTTNYNTKINRSLRRVAVHVERGETEKALRALGFLALRIERGVWVGHAKSYPGQSWKAPLTEKDFPMYCDCGQPGNHYRHEHKLRVDLSVPERRERLLSECPDGLLPDGYACPRCNGSRAPSGIGGGAWVHFNYREES